MHRKKKRNKVNEFRGLHVLTCHLDDLLNLLVENRSFSSLIFLSLIRECLLRQGALLSDTKSLFLSS